MNTSLSAAFLVFAMVALCQGNHHNVISYVTLSLLFSIKYKIGELHDTK